MSASEVGEVAVDPATSPSAGYRKDLRRVLAAEVVSRFGSQLSNLAVPWFVLMATGSASQMGLVFVAEVLPVALLGVPAGILVRRIGPRRTVLMGDMANALFMASIPVLHAANALPLWMLLIIVGLMGAVAGPYLTAQRLLIPEIVGDDVVAVTRANSMLETVTWLARLAGPISAGVLIGLLGPIAVIWLDSGSFLISLLLLVAVRPTITEPGNASESRPRVSDGIRYVLRDRVVGRIVLVAGISGFFFPVIIMSYPLMGEFRYGGHAWVSGALFAAFGGGTAVGTFVTRWIARRKDAFRVGVIASACGAIPLWIFAVPQPVGGVLAAMFISGLLSGLANAPLIAVVTTRPPPEARAQVISVLLTVNMVAAPVAYFGSGVFFNRYGLTPMLVVAALGTTVSGLIMSTLVTFRDRAGDEGGDHEIA